MTLTFDNLQKNKQNDLWKLEGIMYFILLLTFLSFLSAFCHDVVKPVKYLLTRPSSAERRVQAQIVSLKQQLTKISMRDDYINYVKIEREISSLEQGLERLKNKYATRNVIINYGIGYGAQLILSIVLGVLSFQYRYTPVLVFDNKYNFAPFGGMMQFPTGIDGAISVPFWIFVSSFTFRSLGCYFQ